MNTPWKRSSLRLISHALLLAAGSFVAGCGGSSVQPDPPPPPPPSVVHDTPQTTMASFQHSYQYQDSVGFATLLAGNFHYTFSAATDPALVVQYGENWTRVDELASAGHLFSGFTSTGTGTYLPGASSIVMGFYSDQYFDDPAHADSADYYKWVTVARVVMAIEVPGTPDAQTFNVDSRHEFYLVRGDAAVLVAGQPATSNAWYIWRWDDLASPTGGAARMRTADDPSTPAASTSWGRIKGVYRG
jgi:hypothetical protein